MVALSKLDVTTRKFSMKSSLRIVYAGTSSVALPALRCIKTSQHTLVGVLAKRVPADLCSTDLNNVISVQAQNWQIPVIEAPILRPPKSCTKSALARYELAREKIHSLAPDIGVIVSYGVLLGEEILSIPRFGWINLHFSLLPQFRGAAPVQRAIMNGLDSSGFTIFRLERELDSGAILESKRYTFSRNLNSGEEILKMAEYSAPFLVEVLDSLDSQLEAAVPQKGSVTHAPKLTYNECQIDWTQNSEKILRLIRAANPDPSAYFFENNKRIKVISAKQPSDCFASSLAPGELVMLDKKVFVGTADLPVELVLLHPEGKNKMSGYAWWCGLRTRH